MPDNPPELSVVVTTINRIAYLKSALDSLQKQSLREFEIIVLDDGSTDGTIEFLQTYTSSLPFRFETLERRERSYLRNVGARLARGSWIAFLDDDDRWMAEKLQTQMKAVRKNPEVGLFYTFAVPIDASGTTNWKLARLHHASYREQIEAGHSYEALARSCLMFTSTILVKRDVFESVGGFDETLVGAEDWDFYLKVARVSSIRAVELPLVEYRVHEGNSASGGNRDAVGDARIRAAQKHLAAARDKDDSVAESLLLRAISQNHYWAGRNMNALSAGARAFRASPATFLSTGDLGLLARAAFKAIIRKA